jgi:hypothetical protein
LIVLLLALLAWEPPRVTCTTIGGPYPLNSDKPITVELKCCPDGSFVDDVNHPADAKGNLICSRGKA